jgi:hypothetical protein
MRGYIPVTPIEIEEFSTAGFLRSPHAYAMTASFQRENVDEDHEELEFQLSFRAALESRRRLQLDVGYVVALDLEVNQLGVERDDTIELVADLRWTQVESILVSDSEEEELTWFARQEVETQLAEWLRAGKRNGAS